MSDKCNSCKQKSSCNDRASCKIIEPKGRIGNVIAVMSGKGGVGKSTISSLLAIAISEKGYKVGIMDADITGPSIPRLFGIEGSRASSSAEGINPVDSLGGIKIISLNLLVSGEDEPVIWRGPVIAGTVKQFWEKVNWGELDFLIVDLPPGTGDVPLTVMQSLPLSGIVMVSSPQSMVAMIVTKGIRMAKRMKVPLLGLIENMSSVRCPDCGKVIKLFGESELVELCSSLDIDFLGNLPLDVNFISNSDKGKIEKAYAEIGAIKEPVNRCTEKVLQKLEGLCLLDTNG